MLVRQRTMSAYPTTLAYMFEASLCDPAELDGLEDAALVAAVQDGARVAAAAEARRLAAIAVLVRRRCADEVHPDWACDDWDAAAAEVSCALNVGRGRAMGQMDLALTLQLKLPKVGARFLAGDIDLRTVNTIAQRTELVVDEEVLRELDTALAERARAWGPLSQYKLEQAIDVWVEQHDPDAVRRTRNNARGRHFTVGDRSDASGVTSVFGRLTTPDATLLDQRLTAMAKGVCEDDPRTVEQRRADAVGAIAANSTHLGCRCGNPDCPAAVDDGRASSVVVHIVAEQSTSAETVEPLLNGKGLAPTTPPSDARVRPAALIPGTKGGIVPAPLLTELIAHGAKVRFVGAPDAQPEDRYRPSAALQEFIRTRDLTCRFPGCDRPAMLADIDHTVPWPAGVTHPANTKCYCRQHHLLKTFWPGWSERQLPDGTLLVTTPSGHTYTTKPLSSLLFPAWNTTIAAPPEVSPPAATPPPTANPGRQLMMPTRRQTRAKSRAYRINAERARNAAERGDVEEPPF